MSKTYIIAEAGVNHNGDEKLALEMISAAKKAGADAIKFQLFQAESLTTLTAGQVDYQKKAYQQEKTQYEMLKELELPYESFLKLKDCAVKEEIDFIVTPFDLQSLAFLVTLKLPILKIGSGDLTNGPLLLAAAQSHSNIILSTGMSTLAEVEEALKVIAFGFLREGHPTLADLDFIYSSQEAQQKLREKVTLLHCTSEYPAPVEEVNLKAMDTLASAFGLKVGFSDHTVGIEISIAAVARGAQFIEKHFTLNKNFSGPDHRASVDLPELTAMIKAIRHVEQALGTGGKYPTRSETKNKNLVRRTLVASEKINCGEVFSPHNLGIKRSGAGLSPMSYWGLLGKAADKDYFKDEVIQ